MIPSPHRPPLVRGFALALAIALSCATAPDANASAPADEQPQPTSTTNTIHVELRTSELTSKLNGQLAKALDAEIEDRAPKLGLAVEATPAADLVVQVEISQPQAGTQLYVIQSVAVIAGEVAVRGEVQSCIECSAAELLERGLELLPDAAEALQLAKREAEREAAEAREAELAAPPPAPAVEPERERVLAAMGYAGISVSALGLGSSLAGAALLARGSTPTRDEGQATHVNVIDYRPPGWALVGVGLAAMVAGNLLLAIDLGRARPRRTRSSASTIGIAPQLCDAPGLLVQGRF